MGGSLIGSLNDSFLLAPYQVDIVGVLSCDDDVYLCFLLALCKYSTPIHNGANNVKKKQVCFTYFLKCKSICIVKP